MSHSAPASDDQLSQRLKALSERHARLHESGIRAKAEVERLDRELADARAKAQEAWGTGDPEELARLHAKRLAEREREVAAFEESIASVEAELRQIAADLRA